MSQELCLVGLAAGQVLFDVLKTHGGSFAESFWIRIFERVLLPIFDHVRAEVTDTTTFTSERRRAQEDAWLYETCTHCLQVNESGLRVRPDRQFVFRTDLGSMPDSPRGTPCIHI